jgi:ubiquinone/menaquinone biosynthesis C-methylase UbiE
MNKNTDNQWELFGKIDPYFGVLADKMYLSKNITIKYKQYFFQSGFNHLDSIIKNIKNNYDGNFKIKTALDFGCGVGRITIPLSALSKSVIGMDVSLPMIKESKENCKKQSINNIQFIQSDDNLSLLNDKFNFLHSYIVFQHISPNRGMKIFQNLIKNLENGGIGVVHFIYARDTYYKYIISFLKNRIPFLSNVINLIKKRDFYYPQMQMFIYDLDEIYYVLRKNSIKPFFRDYTNHSGQLGVCIYFKK